MIDLTSALAARVIDPRASSASDAILCLLCRFTVDIATEIHGPGVTLEQAEELLDEALAALNPKEQR